MNIGETLIRKGISAITDTTIKFIGKSLHVDTPIISTGSALTAYMFIFYMHLPEYLHATHPNIYNIFNQFPVVNGKIDIGSVPTSTIDELAKVISNLDGGLIQGFINGSWVSLHREMKPDSDGSYTSALIASIYGINCNSVLHYFNDVATTLSLAMSSKSKVPSFVSNVRILNVSRTKDFPKDFQTSGINSDWRCVKPFSELYFPEKSKFIGSLDRRYEQLDDMRKMGIPSKIGVLLYGDPGTGKSSVAYATADRYSLPLIKISWSGSSLKDIRETCDIACKRNSVILFDDCDSMLTTKDESGNLIYRDLMLQLLDGTFISGNTVCIIILTTNFIDKIDSAIQRPGRIDIKREFGNITVEEAREMCSNYDTSLEAMIDMDKENLSNGINPARLQGKILDNTVNKQVDMK